MILKPSIERRPRGNNGDNIILEFNGDKYECGRRFIFLTGKEVHSSFRYNFSLREGYYCQVCNFLCPLMHHTHHICLFIPVPRLFMSMIALFEERLWRGWSWALSLAPTEFRGWGKVEFWN